LLWKTTKREGNAIMTVLRIRNAQGDDLVSIDMDTGDVTISDGVDIDEAARVWWDAVTTIHMIMSKRLGKTYREMIMKSAGVGHGDGVLILLPENREAGGENGSLTIYANVRVEDEEKGAPTWPPDADGVHLPSCVYNEKYTKAACERGDTSAEAHKVACDAVYRLAVDGLDAPE
jgi:hypothetical protein